MCHGQEGHRLLLAMPLARHGHGQALPTPPSRCRLSLASLAGPSRALLLSRVEEKAKYRGQEFEEVGGSKCEAVTQMNSARKDLFV